MESLLRRFCVSVVCKLATYHVCVRMTEYIRGLFVQCFLYLVVDNRFLVGFNRFVSNCVQCLFH